MWPFPKKEPKNLTLKDGDDFARDFGIGLKTQSGAMVTDESALKQSAVYACVRTLAQSVAGLPLSVYERDGEVRRPIDHPLNTLLGVSPNGEQTSFELREFQMTCLGLRGNAFAQKLYDGRGRIGEINPLNARYMNVDRDPKTKKLVFDYQETGNSSVFSASEIWRIAGLGSNGVTGLSPIALARETIGMSIAIEGHGASTFKNGVNPSVILSMDGRLTEESFNRLKEQLDQGSAGYGNAGKPFLAEEGLKPYTISMSNADAEFLASRKFQVEDICRWYGVPPHMVGSLDRATFSNIEQQSLDFVINTLLPWLRRIEATMARDLLTTEEKKRYYFRHNVEGLLRGDTKTRFEAYGSAIDKGWLSRNEIRLLENREPIEGLDQLVLPVNVETISEREQRFANALAQNLANTEINALRQERNKGGDDFGQRMVNFYTRFVNKLTEVGCDDEAAKNYALSRCDQIENKQFEKIELSAQKLIGDLL